MQWISVWENDVRDDTHEGLATLFADAYPRSAAKFQGGRSWSGARPELRIIALDGGKPVAHLGILRRFLRTDEGRSLLVGDVGLVAVHSGHRGQGAGGQLLARAAETLDGLAVPFGYLTCGTHVIRFYETGGWRHLEGQVTRMIDNHQRPEVYTGPSMVLPVRAALADWPHGRAVDRNGWEV
ncbi:GNAT family N-acetyltransferase [Actinokineospora sp. HUAS TT18]|uniref:GNAT family N-acetyltransferase n=1 Tax=Actinokineospora sp. HUAS TT18 TaxID=3447451 RepID=UPI003F525558